MIWKDNVLQGMLKEKYHDVRLVGNDGGKVSCNKNQLAMHSETFDAMFFGDGDFKERKADSVPLPHNSVVIQIVVKYCYSGNVDFDLIFDQNGSPQEEAFLLVDLFRAANYFEMDEVLSRAEDKMGDLVFEMVTPNTKTYQYASALLCNLSETTELDQRWWKAIFQFSVKNAMECLGHGDIYHHMIPSFLPLVLGHIEDTYTIAKCIYVWFTETSGNQREDEDERALIQKVNGALIPMASDLDLTSLSDKQISEIHSCPWFSEKKIIAAFVHQTAQPNRPSVAMQRTVTARSLYVAGAGLECLNGIYHSEASSQGLSTQGSYFGSVDTKFIKEVQHNGNSCFAIIHLGHSLQWLISLTKNMKLGVDKHETDLYESTSDGNHHVIVPPRTLLGWF